MREKRIIAQTDRLILRRLSGNDLQDLYEYLSDEEVVEYDPCNPNSWRLLERLGFVREAYFRKNVYFRKDDHGAPIWKDTYVYPLLSESVHP